VAEQEAIDAEVVQNDQMIVPQVNQFVISIHGSSLSGDSDKLIT
jgi:hypothetical protein